MRSTERRTSGLKTAEPLSPEVPTLTDLKLEEERARIEEEQAVEKKREAAKRLALRRGLSSGEESKTETPISTSPTVDDSTTVPFPAYDPSARPTTPRGVIDVVPEDPETPEQPSHSPTLPTSPQFGEPLPPPPDENSRHGS